MKVFLIAIALCNLVGLVTAINDMRGRGPGSKPADYLCIGFTLAMLIWAAVLYCGLPS